MASSLSNRELVSRSWLLMESSWAAMAPIVSSSERADLAESLLLFDILSNPKNKQLNCRRTRDKAGMIWRRDKLIQELSDY